MPSNLIIINDTIIRNFGQRNCDKILGSIWVEILVTIFYGDTEH